MNHCKRKPAAITRRVGFPLFLWLAVAPGLWAQTALQELKSTDAAVFDTVNPADYGFDFPSLPGSDPMSGMPGREPIPMDTLSNPQLLFESINRTGIPEPSSTPGDYDPQATFQMGNFFNVVQELPLVDYPQAEDSEIILVDKGHPVFYDTSKMALAFGLTESPLDTAMPLIPEPGTVFEKETAPLLRVGPVRMAAEASTSVATISNVFGTESGTHSDTILSFNPRIYMETGTRGFASLLYEPSFLHYTKYGQMDNVNEALSFSLRYPFTKLRIGADFSYLTQSGLFLNSSGPAKRRTYLPSFLAAYPLTGKLTATAAYAGSFQENEPGGNRDDNNVTLGIDDKLAETLSGGGSVQFGKVEAPAGHQVYGTAQLQANYHPDYHFRFGGQAGFQVRHLTPPAGKIGDLVTPVFDLVGSYHRTANIALVLRLYRNVGTDTFNDVDFQIQTGAEGSLLLRLFRKTDLKLRMGTGYAEQFSNADPKISHLGFVQGGLSVSYSVLRTLDVIVYNNIQRRFADSLGQNYVSNTVGFAINVRF